MFTRAFALFIALSVVGVSGCGESGTDSATVSDSTRDLELATAYSEPDFQLNDVPGTPPMEAEPPAPAAPAQQRSTAMVVAPPEPGARVQPSPAPISHPASIQVAQHPPATTLPPPDVARTDSTSLTTVASSIPTGSAIAVTATTRMCSNAVRVGNHFRVAVVQDVAGTGSAAIPAGSVLTLRVVGEAADRLGLTATSVRVNGAEHALSGTVTADAPETVHAATRRRSLMKVLGGAAIGALAGQAAGKDAKATAVGAAAGAAAGTAVAAATAGTAECVPVDGRLTVILDAPLDLGAP
ncbi:MAG: hypothetical protein ACYC2G_10020 [Gemmatimonadaceae bacterium]